MALSKKEGERTGYGLSYHWLSEDSLTEGVGKKKKRKRKSAGSVPKRQGEMEKHKQRRKMLDLREDNRCRNHGASSKHVRRRADALKERLKERTRRRF